MRKIIKTFALLLILCLSVAVLSSCASNNNTSKATVTDAPTAEAKTEVVAKATDKPTEKPTTKPTATPKKTTSSSSRTSSSSSFTNKYGTPTTKCAHTGCNNYIASSGDTNCCTTHSRRCLECNKYIDEDAMYCMDCIKKALGK